MPCFSDVFRYFYFVDISSDLKLPYNWFIFLGTIMIDNLWRIFSFGSVENCGNRENLKYDDDEVNN